MLERRKGSLIMKMVTCSILFGHLWRSGEQFPVVDHSPGPRILLGDVSPGTVAFQSELRSEGQLLSGQLKRIQDLSSVFQPGHMKTYERSLRGVESGKSIG